jgi:serine/threonine protein phosphatase 1
VNVAGDVGRGLHSEDANVMPEGFNLTVAIGDVHGRYDLLIPLLAEIDSFALGKPYALVLLGDLIDRGARSAEVVAHVRKLQREHPDRVVCLRGNHEEMLLQSHADVFAEAQWLRDGGSATLASYNIASAADVPDDVVEWMRSLPTFHEDEHRYFVHAGLDPAQPLHRQRDEDRLWMREPFLYMDHDFGKFVVHGHTPLAWKKGRVPRPDERRNRVNIDTGAVFGGALTAAVFDDRRRGPLGFFQALQNGQITFDVALPYQPPTMAVLSRSLMDWIVSSPTRRNVTSAAIAGLIAAIYLGAILGGDQRPMPSYAEAAKPAAAGPRAPAPAAEPASLPFAEPPQSDVAQVEANAVPRPAASEQADPPGRADPLVQESFPSQASPASQASLSNETSLPGEGTPPASPPPAPSGKSEPTLLEESGTLNGGIQNAASAIAASGTPEQAAAEEARPAPPPQETAVNSAVGPESQTPGPEDTNAAPAILDDGAVLAASSVDLLPAAPETLLSVARTAAISPRPDEAAGDSPQEEAATSLPLSDTAAAPSAPDIVTAVSPPPDAAMTFSPQRPPEAATPAMDAAAAALPSQEPAATATLPSDAGPAASPIQDAATTASPPPDAGSPVSPQQQASALSAPSQDVAAMDSAPAEAVAPRLPSRDAAIAASDPQDRAPGPPPSQDVTATASTGPASVAKDETVDATSADDKDTTGRIAARDQEPGPSGVVLPGPDPEAAKKTLLGEPVAAPAAGRNGKAPRPVIARAQIRGMAAAFRHRRSARAGLPPCSAVPVLTRCTPSTRTASARRAGFWALMLRGGDAKSASIGAGTFGGGPFGGGSSGGGPSSSGVSSASASPGGSSSASGAGGRSSTGGNTSGSSGNSSGSGNGHGNGNGNGNAGGHGGGDGNGNGGGKGKG